MDILRKILDCIRSFERQISKIFLFFIIILVFVASIFRTRFINYPLVWSVDMAQLLFVWVCFFGADIALQQDRHIGVDIITRYLPEKVTDIIKFCSYVLILGFMIIVIYYGTYLALKNSHRLFNGMPISYSWATISAPVGCLLLSITIIEKMVELLASYGIVFRRQNSKAPISNPVSETCD